MIKFYSQEEIKILREGGRKLASIVKELSLKIKPNIEAQEIDALANELMKKAGGAPSFLGHDGFPASICLSINDEVVHGIPGKEKFKLKDVVGIDAGLLFRGLHTDMAITVPVGEVGAKIAHFLETAKKALFLGIEAAKPDNSIGHISEAIQKYVEKNGYSIVKELTGHGVGRELHEEPQIPNFGKREEGEILKPGMVIAIEPIINFGRREVETDIDGWKVKTRDQSISAHFEHTVLITKNGNEVLTI